MKLSERVKYLKQSLTRQLFDMAQGMPNVIDLTLGDPDILPDEAIRNAACEAVMAGRTRYSPNAGLPALRDAVASFNTIRYGLQVEPSEVVVTVGGMEAVYLLLSCLAEAGDEVIIPAPYWINYVQMTQICGATPVIVPSYEEDGFAVTASELEKAVSPRSKVLIINTPNNPTGRVISKERLHEIAEFAITHDLFVISDEVYRSLIYDGKKHSSISTMPGMRGRCAVVDSMSKRFSMTGYRLGYAIAPSELAVCMTRMQENVAACAPLPSQYAALKAYKENLESGEIFDEFSKRRTAILEGIKSIPQLGLSSIDGTFYAFVNISKCKMNSYDFACKLLKKRQVAVVPGRTYGDEYDNYIRIAFTLCCDRLHEAIARIKAFIDEDLHVNA